MAVKNKESANPYVAYYGKYHISPVHQDISNFELHLRRREKLYNAVGIPVIAFAGKRVLEIGPGGGYNALAFFSWGASVDFVEPNPKALSELPVLLAQYNVSPSKYSINPLLIENYLSNKKYDIVVAEGFLLGLPNKQEVINVIARYVKPGGVAVVTCTDEIGYYFDLLRRILANVLVKGIRDFDRKIDCLADAFRKHLELLRYATRPAEDYVADLINPAIWAVEFFNVVDCINFFGKKFSLLGTSSPKMFTDDSWYKDMDFDSTQAYIRQYHQQRHTLLLHTMENSSRSEVKNDELFRQIHRLRMLGKAVDANAEGYLAELISTLRVIEGLVREVSVQAGEATAETIKLLSDPQLTADKISKAKALSVSFGKSQQYVGMYRKFLPSGSN